MNGKWGFDVMRSVAAFVLLLFAQSSGAAPGQVIFTESGVNRTVRVISNACVDVTRAANLWFEAAGYGVIIGALLMIYATLIGTAVLSRAVSSFIKGIRS